MGKNSAPEAPAGYLKLADWAKLNNKSEANVRSWIYSGKLSAITIEEHNHAFYYIKDGTPVPQRKKNYDSHGRPFCPCRECFLNRMERCDGLTECLYKYGKCPFYKPKSSVTVNKRKYEKRK